MAVPRHRPTRRRHPAVGRGEARDRGTWPRKRWNARRPGFAADRQPGQGRGGPTNWQGHRAGEGQRASIPSRTSKRRWRKFSGPGLEAQDTRTTRRRGPRRSRGLQRWGKVTDVARRLNGRQRGSVVRVSCPGTVGAAKDLHWHRSGPGVRGDPPTRSRRRGRTARSTAVTVRADLAWMTTRHDPWPSTGSRRALDRRSAQGTQPSGDQSDRRSHRRGSRSGVFEIAARAWPAVKVAEQLRQEGRSPGWSPWLEVDRMSPAVPGTSPAELILSVQTWAAAWPDVHGVALVGSHAPARRRHPSSDVDLVIVCETPPTLIDDADWIREFGTPRRTAREDRARDLAARVVWRRAGGRIWDRRPHLGIGAVRCRHAAGDRRWLRRRVRSRLGV